MAHGLFYFANTNLEVIAFCDADWAKCTLTRRSVTGYCIMMGGALVLWKSKTQNTFSKFSTEAEYRSATITISELKWISYILQDLQHPITKQIALRCFVLPVFVSIKEQLADVFTKVLSSPQHVYLLSKIGFSSIAPS
ncbi:hypothetical protein LIER_35365 [Lithospermum erythrorhizon]|uniref:Uncharacterized protein n=1 Tax=Lithospermum erythrorhizon TaxID=34254 RepID=A0AAV3NPL2_LITER